MVQFERVNKAASKPQLKPEAGRKARVFVFLFFFAIVSMTVLVTVKFGLGKEPGSTARTSTNVSGSAATKSTNAELPTMEVAQAVMVTVELDFGPTIPSIAEALKQIERRHEPSDGVGRTFAVLDAYGEPTADHKLHMSMHVSSEKPGVGSLIFRRTGEVLWRSKIILGSHSEAPALEKRSLLILVDDGTGKSLTIDGSNNPVTILDASIKELGVPLSSIWSDGTEREFTLLYSACGCPVKAMVRRVGNKTVRAKELPVMFPDDPAALSVISRLMTWE